MLIYTERANAPSITLRGRKQKSEASTTTTTTLIIITTTISVITNPPLSSPISSPPAPTLSSSPSLHYFHHHHHCHPTPHHNHLYPYTQTARPGQQPDQELLRVLLERGGPALQATEGTPSEDLHRWHHHLQGGCTGQEYVRVDRNSVYESVQLIYPKA